MLGESDKGLCKKDVLMSSGKRDKFYYKIHEYHFDITLTAKYGHNYRGGHRSRRK
jgi:hypothetical protein